MRTWGDLRAQLVREFPNAAFDTLDTALRTEYEALLSLRNWQALGATGVLVTAPLVNAGSVAATAGSATVTGAGTAWASALDGRRFQVVGQEPWYTVLAVNSATQLVLDRAFQGPSVTAAGYRIVQDRYEMGPDVREVTAMQLPYGRFTGPEAIQLQPYVGMPRRWEHGEDTTLVVSPQRRTVRLWPFPDAQYAIPYRFTQAVAAYDGTNETARPAEFLPEALLLDGARARLGDEAAAKRQAAAMVALQVADTSRRPAAVLQSADWMNPRRYRG